MAMKGHKPGGGIASRQHVTVPIKTGVGNRGVSVGATGQWGQAQGAHTTDGRETSYRGDNRGRVHQGAALRPAEMGNTLAAQTVCGAGGSRKVYGSGSQGVQGPTNPGMPGLPSTKGQWPD